MPPIKKDEIEHYYILCFCLGCLAVDSNTETLQCDECGDLKILVWSSKDKKGKETVAKEVASMREENSPILEMHRKHYAKSRKTIGELLQPIPCPSCQCKPTRIASAGVQTFDKAYSCQCGNRIESMSVNRSWYRLTKAWNELVRT